MTLMELLAHLRSRDVRLWIENDRLKYSAPQGALTPELLAELRHHKPDVLCFLRQSYAAIQPAPGIERQTRDRELPLSYGQQQLWFLAQLEIDLPLHHIAEALHFKGPLQLHALYAALQQIVKRHEILRTTFPACEGRPRQAIAPSSTIPTLLINFQALPHAQQQQSIQKLSRLACSAPFDLAQGPLLRIILLRLTPEEHKLLVTMHHTISDSRSHQVFYYELATFYNAISTETAPSLPELPIQYADFALWQHEVLKGQRLEEHLAYWRQQLADAPGLFPLPTDRPRPASQVFSGATYSFTLPQQLAEQLGSVSMREGVTPFITLLAAFQVLLARYSGQNDIILGIIVANRTQIELESLIGFFVNTLVVRVDVSDQPTFSTLLRRTYNICLQAYKHQELPFERLVEALHPVRDLSYNPLVQVSFQLETAHTPEPDFHQLCVERHEIALETTHMDLALDMIDANGVITGKFEYSTALFDSDTIERMANHFQHLLTHLLENTHLHVTEVAMMSSEEYFQQLQRSRVIYSDSALTHSYCWYFEQQVALSPDAVAVVFEDQHLTYGALNDHANQLAHHLRNSGIRQGSRVAIFMKRSIDFIVGLLGVMKTGAAYVPLDPAYPHQRQLSILRDIQTAIVLTQCCFLSNFSEQEFCFICLDAQWKEFSTQCKDNLHVSICGTDIAYLIYTSGSTGEPKGVMVSHGAVVNHNRAFSDLVRLQSSDRVLQSTSISFDASIEELLPTWLYGATVVLLPPSVVLPDIVQFIKFLAEEMITILNLATAYWHEWVRALGQPQLLPPSVVRMVVIGGEKAFPELFTRWYAIVPEQIRCINTYGPTEGTITTTAYEPECTPTAQHIYTHLPIGRPLSNLKVYILDKYLQIVPVGIAGEMYIGGAGLAYGYWQRAALTAERFIPDPYGTTPGERLYKTGDIARYQSDGNIDFVGRNDHQVKLRGFRIELHEIEIVLRQHPLVQECVVLVQDDAVGNKRLIAYVVLKEMQVSFTATFRNFLAEKLPDYMIPAIFIPLATLPLNPHGKIDFRALPDTKQLAPESLVPFVAPRTALEEVIAGIWGDILQLNQVSIHANFFASGGHSLLATQLLSRLRQALYVDIPLRALFEDATVAGLAAFVSRDPQTKRIAEKTAEIFLSVIKLSQQEYHSRQTGKIPSA